MSKLILGSGSPRRLELLKQINIIPNDMISSNINEIPHKNEKPRHLALRLAQEKARSIWSKIQDKKYFILSADNVVACGNRILGKPNNEIEARDFLSLLSGRRHRVYGGICIINPDGIERCRIVQTKVQPHTMHIYPVLPIFTTQTQNIKFSREASQNVSI